MVTPIWSQAQTDVHELTSVGFSIDKVKQNASNIGKGYGDVILG